MLNESTIPFPTFTTDRLLLRQLLESDVEEVFVLRSDKVINKYLDREMSKTLNDSLDFIRKTNEAIKNSALKYWAIELNNTKKLIGTICLFGHSDSPRKSEIGYELLTEYQGQGIMKEATNKIIDYAFETLKLNAIEAYSHKDNLNSIKLLNKLKFEKIDQPNIDLNLFRLFKSL